MLWNKKCFSIPHVNYIFCVVLPKKNVNTNSRPPCISFILRSVGETQGPHIFCSYLRPPFHPFPQTQFKTNLREMWHSLLDVALKTGQI